MTTAATDAHTTTPTRMMTRARRSSSVAEADRSRRLVIWRADRTRVMTATADVTVRGDAPDLGGCPPRGVGRGTGRGHATWEAANVPPLRRPSRAELVAAGLAALPWTWYLVRDLNARLDIVALAWPVLGVVASLAWGLTALLARRWTTTAIAMSWTICTLAVVVGPWRPLDTGSVRPDGRIRIVAANVLGGHTFA